MRTQQKVLLPPGVHHFYLLLFIITLQPATSPCCKLRYICKLYLYLQQAYWYGKLLKTGRKEIATRASNVERGVKYEVRNDE